MVPFVLWYYYKVDVFIQTVCTHCIRDCEAWWALSRERKQDKRLSAAEWVRVDEWKSGDPLAGLYAVRISRVNSPLMYLRLRLYRPHVCGGGGAPPHFPSTRGSFIHTVELCVAVDVYLYVCARSLARSSHCWCNSWLIVVVLWLWCLRADVRYGDLCTDGETAQARAQLALVIGGPWTQESKTRSGE